MNSREKILFIRTDRIGDTLMNLPAVHLLRQAYPDAEIHWMVDEALQSLLSVQQDVQRLIPVSRASIEKKRSYRWLLCRQVRKERYTMIIVSNPSKFFHFMAWYGGASKRLGYARKWGFFLTHRLKPVANNIAHEIDRNLGLVSLITDKKWDGSLNWPVSEDAVKKTRELMDKENLKNKKLVLVHAGSTNPKRLWPVGSFQKLCQKILADEECVVIFIGGEETAVISESLRKACGDHARNWAGRLSLPEFQALVAQPECRLLISVDSGPGHIAWMNGLPTVILYAQNVEGCNPSRWGARGTKSEAIYKPILNIQPEEVLGAYQRIMSAGPVR